MENKIITANQTCLHKVALSSEERESERERERVILLLHTHLPGSLIFVYLKGGSLLR